MSYCCWWWRAVIRQACHLVVEIWVKWERILCPEFNLNSAVNWLWVFDLRFLRSQSSLVSRLCTFVWVIRWVYHYYILCTRTHYLSLLCWVGFGFSQHCNFDILGAGRSKLFIVFFVHLLQYYESRIVPTLYLNLWNPLIAMHCIFTCWSHHLV